MHHIPRGFGSGPREILEISSVMGFCRVPKVRREGFRESRGVLGVSRISEGPRDPGVLGLDPTLPPSH